MNRIEQLRIIIDKILHSNRNTEDKRASFVHLYGVSTVCSMLALKRNLDPEIASAIGMLHDISSFITGNTANHSKESSIEAGKLLFESGLFSNNEIKIIVQAICNHSDKENIHDVYDELIKDADVLQHYLYNTSLPVIEKDKRRLLKLKEELYF